MKKVIIAEKPSVARNIADALGIKSRTNGYMEGESYIITWVFGHLLQLYDAYDYDEKMSNWRLENSLLSYNNFSFLSSGLFLIILFFIIKKALLM